MQELKLEIIEKIKSGELQPDFEILKPLIHPQGITNGVMTVDREKCSSCGLCIQNCPFKCWEMGEDKFPRMKSKYICFSCFNCIIACPKNAVTTKQAFSVKDAFFDTDFPPLKHPAEPRDAEGKPDEWNYLEKMVMNRRSVRNFKKDPVPEPLVRRILEAGRFCPSGGNQQLWKFTVVTDPKFLKELEDASQAVWEGMYGMITDNVKVLDLVKTIPVPVFDPRIKNGMGCVARKELPVLLGAPTVIYVAAHSKMGDPEIHAGIVGQTMTLVAKSLGVSSCYAGFGRAVNFIPELSKKLGFGEYWTVHVVLCLGYPKFKQEGIVPRHFRPVTWFRPGSNKPDIEK